MSMHYFKKSFLFSMLQFSLVLTIYNMMIPGSKGQKADASLLARGFLTS